MTPEQLVALRAWLLIYLKIGERISDPAITFPDSHCYKETATDSPRTAYPVCTFAQLAEGENGRAPQRIKTRTLHKFTLTIDALPAADFDVEITTFLVPAGFAFTGSGVLTTSPGVDIEATRDDLLGQLQALEGPGHVATYLANGTASIDVAAAAGMEGYPLQVKTDSSDLSAATTQDVLLITSRDLSAPSVSIRIETKQDGASLDERERAYHIARKVAKYAKARIGLEALNCLGVAVRTVSGPVNVTRLLGGSQGVEVATLVFVFNVTADVQRYAGTIECVNPIAGTLKASDADDGLTVETEINP